jgi:hypothetical protein
MKNVTKLAFPFKQKVNRKFLLGIVWLKSQGTKDIFVL